MDTRGEREEEEKGKLAECDPTSYASLDSQRFKFLKGGAD